MQFATTYYNFVFNLIVLDMLESEDEEITIKGQNRSVYASNMYKKKTNPLFWVFHVCQH